MQRFLLVLSLVAITAWAEPFTENLGQVQSRLRIEFEDPALVNAVSYLYLSSIRSQPRQPYALLLVRSSSEMRTSPDLFLAKVSLVTNRAYVTLSIPKIVNAVGPNTNKILERLESEMGTAIERYKGNLLIGLELPDSLMLRYKLDAVLLELAHFVRNGAFTNRPVKDLSKTSFILYSSFNKFDLREFVRLRRVSQKDFRPIESSLRFLGFPRQLLNQMNHITASFDCATEL